MSEDSRFNRDQKKEEERGIALDFSGSLGKGMLAKEKIETLENSSGLTPLGFGVNDRNRIMNRDSAGVGFSTTEYAENTEILNNSSGLSPLRLSGEIYSINKKKISLIEDFSGSSGKGMLEKEKIETLRTSSGLTPLNFDSELQIKVPGITPLQGIRVDAKPSYNYKGE
jgi:hypothetical protein